MRTETVYFAGSEFGNFAIHIDGLAEVLEGLRSLDANAERAIRDALRDAMNQTVLPKAKSKASRLNDDGSFARSIKVGQRAKGTRWVLYSHEKDPHGVPIAGVKEFANRGARTVSSRGTPLANSRLRMHSGVGVPTGNPPRALIPAVNESITALQDRIETELARVMERIIG